MVLTLDRWVGKVAIVTGASAGIGAGIAERLVREGLKVVGLARRKENIEALSDKLSDCKGKLYALKVDLTKEEDILNAVTWITNNLGPIHILINNAGTGGENSSSPISNGNTQEWMQILNTNVIGLSTTTREAIKNMKENKIDGHIINIGSILGHYVLNIPELQTAMYTASKHAVTALAEAIRQELVNVNSKIKISNISPGLVLTELVPSENTQLQQLIKENKYLRSEDIADGIVYILSTPPHVQIHELMIKPVGEVF